MNRREALSRVALLLGGTVVGAGYFQQGCKSADKKATNAAEFTQDDIAYLDEIAETIIPTTDTPGAKAAGVGAFMTVMVRDCYEENQQQEFRRGMKKINELSKEKYDGHFMQLTAQQRHDLLVLLDREASEHTQQKKEEDVPHYFRLMKELTLLGYFTSEPGATQSLHYVETPGKYEACIPYEKGDRAWALG